MTERTTPATLRCIREGLGLTSEDLAALLGVRHDTVRRWESGREPVPYGVPADLARITADIAAQVAAIIGRHRDDPTAPVTAWADRDAELFGAEHHELEDRGWSPRVWRVAVGRAAAVAPLKVQWPD